MIFLDSRDYREYYCAPTSVSADSGLLCARVSANIRRVMTSGLLAREALQKWKSLRPSDDNSRS